MSGTYVASPPAPPLADDVELGPVRMTDEEREAVTGAHCIVPKGAVLARTTWTDRDGVMQYAEEQLGRSTHCLMLTGDLTLFVSLRADGEMQIIFQRGEDDDENHETLISGVFDPTDDRFHMRRRRRGHSAVDSTE
jgi:hypothetical protein